MFYLSVFIINDYKNLSEPTVSVAKLCALSDLVVNLLF